MMSLSVTIITYNEERNLERALRSASFAEEIIVVDSFSTDRTVEIAQRFGARVFQHKFIGFGAQKNLAASYAKNPWIFSMDADEEISEELRQVILQAILVKNAPDIFTIDRRTYFMGQWIKYGGWSPDILPRLYRKDAAEFTNPKVHENLVAHKPGPIGHLKGAFNHYSFPTFESQVRTNLKYAKLGAKPVYEKKGAPSLVKVLIKPLGKFFECYFIKLGLLDGKAGLFIALNASYSIFMKYAFAHFGEIDYEKCD